jgi:hypothetical protein
VIELGHALKLSVTAEGVETREQFGNLQAAGCDTAQGFLFFRPEPPEEIAKLFAGAHAAAKAAHQDSPKGGGRVQRRPISPNGTPGSRRRLARSSLLAGFKAMADTWANGESRA